MGPTENPADNDRLPHAAPDAVEQEFADETDNIVPTRGHEMRSMVGLGGSAGSISALQTFFELMPADSGMVFVVILHLSPEHESILAEVLQRSTRMPVVQVQKTVKVEPDHVYVIPPGKTMTSVNGSLKLDEIPSDRSRRAAIDLFFRSLADTYGLHSAAIVLSGVDGDGATGIKRIKERGGLTIAQSPEEAEYAGMPRSAIATGMVDWILGVRQMPAKLIEYQAFEKKIKVPPEEGPQPATLPQSAPDDGESALRDVLTFLRTCTGRDFTYYKRATILRRISRRMQVNGVGDLAEYLTFLRTHPGEAGALLQDLLISVTNFFRDREAFETLRHHLPNLFRGKGKGDAVRVWVAACATGEEAYSIAMMLAEHARGLESPPAIQVFATDLDEDVIRAAREGVYPETIVADVSEERIRTFFVHEPRGYRIRRDIRELVLFAVHDVLKDSPFSRLDLVTCRNLLIYLTREAQDRALEIFHFALQPGGLLFLGASESVDESSGLYAALDRKNRLYLHKPASRTLLPLMMGQSTLARALKEQEHATEGPVIARRALETGTPAADLIPPTPQSVPWAELHYQLIERLSPPSILVDAEHEILHVSESAGRFLRVRGEPTRNLLALINPELRIELRAVLYRAAQTQTPIEASSLPCRIEGEPFAVTIRVKPAEVLSPGAMLVVFESSRSSSAEEQAPRELDQATAARDLERELERMKARHRDTVERYEAAAEELRASHEELQAMNEELRSATEELESSREELQSMNEEQKTVNQELKSNVDELTRANSDLRNLMASTEIATIFLDSELRITRYTPQAVSLFNLIPSDVGRPLNDLNRHLDYPQLPADAARVLETLALVEREVGVSDGAWYQARLRPYRTIDDRIAGVVLTFVDITLRKQAEEVLQRSEAQARDDNAILDERVRQRTAALEESEARLRESAETSDQRARQLHDLAADLTDAEQRERHRLATILHDHVQQMLVAARMRVDLVKSDVADPRMQQRLEEANNCINDALNAARGLAVELVPPLLHDQGLPAALEWLGGQFEDKYGLSVVVEADPEGPSDENIRDLLFHAARELLLNVVKHAQTQEAWLDLRRTETELILEVRDEGAGFSSERSQGLGHSFGLFHMRERLGAVGGSLVVQSRVGAGTKVTIVLPLLK